MFSNAILPVAMLWESCVLGSVHPRYSSTRLVDNIVGAKISLILPQTTHAFSRTYQHPKNTSSLLLRVSFPRFTQPLLIKLYKYIKV